MEDKMENIFVNSNNKIGFTEPIEKLHRKVSNTKFGKTKVGYGVIFASAAASNLFTWPLQVADLVARKVDPNHFGPSKEYEESVKVLEEVLDI